MRGQPQQICVKESKWNEDRQRSLKWNATVGTVNTAHHGEMQRSPSPPQSQRRRNARPVRENRAWAWVFYERREPVLSYIFIYLVHIMSVYYSSPPREAQERRSWYYYYYYYYYYYCLIPYSLLLLLLCHDISFMSVYACFMRQIYPPVCLIKNPESCLISNGAETCENEMQRAGEWGNVKCRNAGKMTERVQQSNKWKWRDKCE